LNLYGYTFNNPVNWVDSLGLEVNGTFDLTTGQVRLTDDATGRTTQISGHSGGHPWGAPIPTGNYDILNHPKRDCFRLEPTDSPYGDDTDNASGRDKFRLHKPGRTIGCIAAKDQAQWDAMRDFIRATSTSTTTVQSKSWNPFASSTETITKFGNMSVIRSNNPLPFRVTPPGIR